jgi:perosamine synthetase
VHVNGRGGSIHDVVAVAREHRLRVVEDASEALASSAHGVRLGSIGDAAAFSFAPTKLVTTGQGGVVVTDDADVVRRVRELKDQGRATRGTGGADHHPVFGFNFKLTNVQAAIGLAQLDRVEERLAHIRALEEWYQEGLADVPGIRLVGSDRAAGEALAWIDVVVDDRTGLVEHLRADGIDPREFWFPLHTQPPYAADDSSFANARWISEHGLWLPSALTLTREDVARVCASVRTFAGIRSEAGVT